MKINVAILLSALLLASCGKFKSLDTDLVSKNSLDLKPPVFTKANAYRCDLENVEIENETKFKTCTSINRLNKTIAHLETLISYETKSDDKNDRLAALCMNAGISTGDVDQVIQSAYPITREFPSNITKFRQIMATLYGISAKVECYCVIGCGNKNLYLNSIILKSELEDINKNVFDLAHLVGLD